MFRIKEKIRKTLKRDPHLFEEPRNSTSNIASTIESLTKPSNKWKKMTSIFRRRYSTFAIFSTSCCFLLLFSLYGAHASTDAVASTPAYVSSRPLSMRGVIHGFAGNQHVAAASAKAESKLSMSPAFSQRLRTAERSMNRISLLGRVGGDPEIRALPSGEKVATFSLATSDSWRDKISGDIRVRTEWHRICVYDSGLCEVVEKFIKKGRRLFLEGTLQSRRYTTSEGYERSITEVILPRFRGELILLENPDDRNDYSTNTGSTEESSSSFFQGSGGEDHAVKRPSGGGLYDM
ncbi:single-strand binding protein [Cardiosporidium cionae]|uniref:Single-strand binding protein n=1 Tax=Cardiosporidium cionae TaxID=476202 RepID=A0ABQ7J9H4_9APIC|nr:single-strand binding protein [Cardiosporidium cionae]|eukprot:KAF8820608.1 single-strand binding protein [Cardiosporidium cionae]